MLGWNSQYQPVNGKEAEDVEAGAILDDEYDEEEAEDAESRAFFEDVDSAITLSHTERLYGFLICFALGWLLSFASVGQVSLLVLGRPNNFAVLYSSGNVVSLCSTMFLFGPWKQLKSMFEETRRGSTLVYIGSIAFTLFAAFSLHSIPLVLLSMFVQMVSLYLYLCFFMSLVLHIPDSLLLMLRSHQHHPHLSSLLSPPLTSSLLPYLLLLFLFFSAP